MTAPAEYLCPPGFAGPRGLGALVREASMVFEAARYAARRGGRADRMPVSTTIDAIPAGDPVLLVPGFLAGDYSLMAMHRHLRSHGHRTYRSYIRANIGCLKEAADNLERRVETVAAKRDRTVVLVGHSLGGLLARGLAADRPDLVGGLVTLGSPMLAPTAVHRLVLLDVAVLVRLSGLGLKRVMGSDCTSGECAREMWEHGRVPLPRGFAYASVYSRRDGIIDWRACLDEQAKAVEVTSSHGGMAFDPAVLDVVTEMLGDLRAKQARHRTRLSRTVAG